MILPDHLLKKLGAGLAAATAVSLFSGCLRYDPPAAPATPAVAPSPSPKPDSAAPTPPPPATPVQPQVPPDYELPDPCPPCGRG